MSSTVEVVRNAQKMRSMKGLRGGLVSSTRGNVGYRRPRGGLVSSTARSTSRTDDTQKKRYYFFEVGMHWMRRTKPISKGPNTMARRADRLARHRTPSIIRRIVREELARERKRLRERALQRKRRHS